MLPKAIRVLVVLAFITSISSTLQAQSPTSADVMRDRISKAKAQLVVKNYAAAIYDLENIRRETNDRTIHRVLNILLMHAYLEQGDYKRTQKFLGELYKSKKPTAGEDYLAIAGQVVSGARTQLKRYQVLGLEVSDEYLPGYAVEDLNQMRKTLELIITQSKELSKNKRLAPNALALLEETSNARSSLGRDDYDKKRWQTELAFARQQIATSGSRVINVLDPIEAPDPNIVAANTPEPKLLPLELGPEEDEESDTDSEEPKEKSAGTAKSKSDEGKETPTAEEKVAEKKTDEESKKKEVDSTPAKTKPAEKKPETVNPMPSDRKVRVIGSAPPSKVKRVDPEEEARKNDEAERKRDTENEPKKEEAPVERESVKPGENASPVTIGSLIGYATKRVNPVYPRQARYLRMTGVVKVQLVVDEQGRVAEVGQTEGPALLKRAARDAVRKWQFRPFVRDGQPVKASGFVSFNFNL